MDIKNIRIEDFNYPLPDERIALHPLARRDACKLLVSLPDGRIFHNVFSDLPDFIDSDALLICNETRVINARMEFFKESGGRIEIFILEPFEPSDYVLSFAAKSSCVWTCMIGNLKKWKDSPLHKQLIIDGVAEPVTLTARLLPLIEGETPSASRRVEFNWDNPDVTFAEIVEVAGNIPIPPYLKRASESSDLDDYQTVYSRVEGSVAAPTAGLHFTPELFGRLEAKGVEVRKVTLHVGAGTFQPVKSERIGDHPMHTESIHVDLDTIRAIIRALEQRRRIVAVGTTSVRTLESLPYFGILCREASPAEADAMHLPQWMAYERQLSPEEALQALRDLAEALERAGLDALTASTAIMIAPGFSWKIVNTLVTNFHQPQSTLLLLVSSFLESGKTNPSAPRLRWRQLYDEALARDYRFLSYGDACLFFPLQAEAMQAQAMPSEAKQAQAMPSEAMQAQAMPSEAMQAQAMPSEAMQAQAMPSEAKQAQAEVGQVDEKQGEAPECMRFVGCRSEAPERQLKSALAVSYDRADNPDTRRNAGLLRSADGVKLPLSKSIALRVMTLNAVASRLGLTPAEIPELPDAEDVEGMAAALKALAQGKKEVYIGEGGAPIRFFTALAASIPGADITVTASPGLCRRPMKILIDALRQAGADIECLENEGFPPLRIRGAKLAAPAGLTLDPGVSSQYISALMMASPLWEGRFSLRLEGEHAVSTPYIAMTAEIMKSFGAEVSMENCEIKVSGTLLPPEIYPIEADWSAASYFYEMALMNPGHKLPIANLAPARDSLQGDSRCAAIFAAVGVETNYNDDGSAYLLGRPEDLRLVKEQKGFVEFDLNDTPDLAPALAVGLCLAGIGFRLNSVGHLRHKETDRLAALQTELAKLGYNIEVGENEMIWHSADFHAPATPSAKSGATDASEQSGALKISAKGGAATAAPCIETYHDHRMAMAFAPAALRLPAIIIENPDVVGKSFPTYWKALRLLNFHLDHLA